MVPARERESEWRWLVRKKGAKAKQSNNDKNNRRRLKEVDEGILGE